MPAELTLTHNSLALYEQIFANNNDPKLAERLVWMHEKNPAQKNYFSIFLDEQANRPAALYAVFPVIFQQFGKQVNAVQSIDTITDINYRGMGLFKKLAIDCYQHAKADGVGFVYGFPNDQSAPGFFKSLGWSPIAEVPFLIKPLNLFYPLKYKFKKNIPFYFNINLGLKWLFTQNKYTSKVLHSFDDEYNALWQKYATSFQIGVVRNATYMNWRIANHPTEQYTTHAYYSNNVLVAIFVLAVKEEKHHGKMGYVIDTIYDPSYANDMPYLFYLAQKSTFYKAKVDAVLGWCFNHSNNHILYKKTEFYTIPKKLQPIKLFFGANNFDNSNDTTFFDKKNWYLSYCDSDTV